MIPLAEAKARLLHRPDVRAAYDAMEDGFALAEKLIRARSQAGMTQADVAEKMKTSQSYVAKLESGLVSPSMRALQRYAQATGATLKITLEHKAAP